MNKLINWLENSCAPKLNKITQNLWVTTIKDSMMQILPFILLGSLFAMGTIVQDFITIPFSFWVPFRWSMGMTSILVAFLIPFNFCEKKRMRKNRLVAGSTGLILFFMALNPEIIASETVGFGFGGFGPGGMFVAFMTGLFTCLVFNIFGRFSFFKEDSPLPDFIRQWFDVLLPVGIIIFGSFLAIELGGLNVYLIATSIFMPLQNALNSWYGFILINFIYTFIYSMGIATWVLTPVAAPVRLASITTNTALVAAGTATAANLEVFTHPFMFSAYMWIGGIGTTLPLAIMLLRSRAKKLKALGRASIGPSIFNINEPLVFGCIAWNPIMMLPMWIIGLVIPTLAWLGTKVLTLAPIPSIPFDLWYTPYPVSTWIATQGSLMAIVLMLIIFLVATLIWYPFFKVYERQCIKEESLALTTAQEGKL